MKKILILLSLVSVFSISCEDDMVEKLKEIEVKAVEGETINFDDIDTYELGDLVDLQIDIVLPAGSKVVASDFEVSTFVSDAAQVVNSEAGYVVMAENYGGETMLLGYALPPAEVKSSLAMKSALIKSKATYNNSEISCRSTMLSLVMMSLGNLDGIPSAEVMAKVLDHEEFDQLVAKFTDRFNNDPIFLEKINEDKEIKDQIRKVANDVMNLIIDEILSNTKSSGLINNFNFASAWDTYEPWYWYGEANLLNVTAAPFLAQSQKSGVPLREQLAIANPTNINYIADFYDENGVYQDWRFVGRNSTLIQKTIQSGAAQSTIFTDVDFKDGFDKDKNYKVVIKKCLLEDHDEARHWMLLGVHVLRVSAGIFEIVADGSVFDNVATQVVAKNKIVKAGQIMEKMSNTVNLADLASPSNLWSIIETGSQIVYEFIPKDKVGPIIIKALSKIGVKMSTPSGWAVMALKAVNDFVPMTMGLTLAPAKVEYEFNLDQNKVWDVGEAPQLSVANISPLNNVDNVDSPIELKWEGNADKYQLQVWNKKDALNIRFYDKSSDKSKILTDLSFGQVYAWRVIAFAADGTQKDGATWEFTMANGENQKPTKPVAMYPLGLEDNIPTSMRFEWTKSTDPNPDDLIQYKLTYFYEKDGEVAEKFEKIVEETYYDAKLKAGQTYYWNVVALDDRDAKALGNSYAFTTIPNTAPSTPVLISPTDNSTDLSPTVEFSWNACSDVDDDNLSYEITVQTDDEVKLATTQNTSYSFTLTANTTYTWYVTVNDNNGEKTKSDAWSFTTNGESNIDTELFDNFSDGDFTHSPQWDLWNNDDHPGKATIQSGYVQFERTGAGGNGGSVLLEKELNISITPQTIIKFDVNPIYSDVGDGAGWSATEYPIFVQLYLEDASGEEKILRYAYNYRGGASKIYNNVTQVAFPNCEQNVWKRGETFSIQNDISNAQKIIKIRVGGSGWNYKGAIDNISISESSSSFNLNENFEEVN